MIVATGPALAADMAEPVLRGSFATQEAAAIDWTGFYFGGSFGYTDVNFTSRNSVQDLFGSLLPNLAIESIYGISRNEVIPSISRGRQGTTFGAFAGYNMQWDDVVLGIEAEYHRVDLTSRVSGGPLVRQYSYVNTAGTPRVATVEQRASVRATIDDYVTLRARAGVAFGSFMPYVTAGLALGRGSYEREASVRIAEVNGTVAPSLAGVPAQVAVDRKKDDFEGGLTVGAGFDYAISPNLFLRADYQYLYFGTLARSEVTLHHARVGVGVKF
jgi:opacity protein-like surface antigen